MSLFSWLKLQKAAEPVETEICSADPDVLTHVVLSAVKRTLHGYNDFNTGSFAALDAEMREIHRLRTWAKTLTDRRIRNEYFSWLDHYERGVGKAREELMTQAKRKTQQALFAEVRECQAAGVVPLPPEKP
jgi:hypothetical protein